MSTRVRIDLDSDHDVLYVNIADERVHISKTSPNDGDMIIGCSQDGRIVGVQVLSPTGLLPEDWADHPDRERLPEEIRQALDAWWWGTASAE